MAALLFCNLGELQTDAQSRGKFDREKSAVEAYPAEIDLLTRQTNRLDQSPPKFGSISLCTTRKCQKQKIYFYSSFFLSDQTRRQSLLALGYTRPPYKHHRDVVALETLPITVGFVVGCLLWTGASQYPLPRLSVLRFALGQRLDLWRRSVLTQGGPQ